MPTFIIIRMTALLFQFVFFFNHVFWPDRGYRDEGMPLIFCLSFGFLALFTIWNKGIALAFVASMVDAIFIQKMLTVTPISFEYVRIGAYVLQSTMFCVFMVVFLGLTICVLSGDTYRKRWVLLAQATAWFSILVTTAISHIRFPWYSTSWELHPWMIGAVLTIGFHGMLFNIVRKHRWEDPESSGGGYTPLSVPEEEAQIPYTSSQAR